MKIKELIYDLNREKDPAKAHELILTYVAKSLNQEWRQKTTQISLGGIIAEPTFMQSGDIGEIPIPVFGKEFLKIAEELIKEGDGEIIEEQNEEQRVKDFIFDHDCTYQITDMFHNHRLLNVEFQRVISDEEYKNLFRKE